MRGGNVNAVTEWCWGWLFGKNRAALRRILRARASAQGTTNHTIRRVAYAKLLNMRRVR